MGELSATTLIVPTIGRPSLHALLRSLAASAGPPLHELIVVDDRPSSFDSVRSANSAQDDKGGRSARPSTAALRASAQDDKTAALRASAQDDKGGRSAQGDKGRADSAQDDKTAALRASAQDDKSGRSAQGDKGRADSAQGDGALEIDRALAARIAERTRVLRSGGRGPAATRNAGWRAATTPCIAFLDDDVVVHADWRSNLQRDLQLLAAGAGGVAAEVDVPLPPERSATDWERNVAGLRDAAWITADMVYRRDALEAVGGFDERFRHAYREDADLALRIRRAGYALTTGRRRTHHPVRKADRWVSVRLQRGNADDVLMRALHGPHWRELAQAPRGRFRRHALTVAAAACVPIALALRAPKAAAAAGALWLGLWTDFALARIAPGPKTPDEIATMAVTSAAIPFAAVYHAVAGALTLRHRLRGAA